MSRDVGSPEAYRASLGGSERELLEEIRKVILAEAPDLPETIRHGMLEYSGLASLAAQKGYVALYVAPPVLARHRGDFPGVSSGKSCLRFASLAQLDRVSLRRLLRAVRRYRLATRP